MSLLLNSVLDPERRAQADAADAAEAAADRALYGTGLERFSMRELLAYPAIALLSVAACFACDWQFWIDRWTQ